MSWQDDMMIEQEQADALNYMGEAEWRDLYRDDEKYETRTMKLCCPHCKEWFIIKLHIDKDLGDVMCDYHYEPKQPLKGYKGGRIKRPRKK